MNIEVRATCTPASNFQIVGPLIYDPRIRSIPMKRRNVGFHIYGLASEITSSTRMGRDVDFQCHVRWSENL